MLTIAPPLRGLAVLPLHLRQLMLHGVEHAHQVDVDDAARLLRRHLRQAHEALRDAGIVDGDVETAEALDGERDQLFRQLLLRDVAAEHDALGRQRRGECLHRTPHRRRTAPAGRRLRPIVRTGAVRSRRSPRSPGSSAPRNAAFPSFPLRRARPPARREASPYHCKAAPFRDWKHCRRAPACRRPGRSPPSGKTRRPA